MNPNEESQLVILQRLAEEAVADMRRAQRAARVAKMRANIFEKLCKFGSYTVIARRGFASLAHLQSTNPKHPWREGHEFFRFVACGNDSDLAEAERAAEMIVAMGDDK